MLIRQMDFVVEYVVGLDASLKKLKLSSLTQIQCNWLVTVLMGLIVAGSLSWVAFARRSLGVSTESQLRWMFRYAKIAWDLLLQASVTHLISHYGITIKKALALQLLATFAKNHPEIHIQSVLADALYGNADFMDEASKVTSCTQVISQLRTNQLVRNRNGKNTSLRTYFSRTSGVETKMQQVLLME